MTKSQDGMRMADWSWLVNWVEPVLQLIEPFVLKAGMIGSGGSCSAKLFWSLKS